MSQKNIMKIYIICVLFYENIYYMFFINIFNENIQIDIELYLVYYTITKLKKQSYIL